MPPIQKLPKLILGLLLTMGAGLAQSSPFPRHFYFLYSLSPSLGADLTKAPREAAVAIGNGVINGDRFSMEGTNPAFVTSGGVVFDSAKGALVLTSQGSGSAITVNLFPGANPASFSMSAVVAGGSQAGAYGGSGNISVLGNNAAEDSPGLAGGTVSYLTGESVQDLPPDLTLGGPFKFEFRRYYGSFLDSSLANGKMGRNWRNNFDIAVYVTPLAAQVVTFRGEFIQFKSESAKWVLQRPYRWGYQLISVAGGGFRFLDPADKLVYSFNSSGALIRIEDRNGNALTVTQALVGPTQAIDGLGRALVFFYDSDGKLSRVQDHSSRSVAAGYTSGNLTSWTDASGRATVYSYTSGGGLDGLLTRATLPAGNDLFTQTYAGSSVATQADGLGNSSTFAYGPLGTATGTDPLGNTTSAFHPDLRSLTAAFDANGESTGTNFDANQRPIQFRDRSGGRTSITYHDASGYIATETDAEGNTTTYTYAASSPETGPLAGFTFYDRTKATYADGTSVSLAYDAAGNVLRRTGEDGKVTSYTYNSRGQVTTQTDPLGNVSTSTYNNDGTLASFTAPSGDITSFNYDSVKRIRQIVYPDNSSESFSFDPFDQIAAYTNPRGKVTRWTFNQNRKLASVTDALGNTTSLAYDAAGNVTSIRNPAGAVSRTYNAGNLPVVITAPTGEATSYVYDKLLRVSSISDRSGVIANFTYTRAGILAFRTDPLNRAAAYPSNKLGRSTGVVTPKGEEWRLSYDSRGRVNSAQDPLGGTLSLAYDSRGRLTRISGVGQLQTSITRNDAGSITSILDPNAGAWRRTLDSMGRATALVDPLGRSISVAYDSRNRVVSFSSVAGGGKFTYDPAGNLLRRQYADTTDITYTFDDMDRVTAANGVTLAYDSTGRISDSNGMAITRDASGRITAIAYPPGAVSYTYNNRGLLSRIQDWAGGTTALEYDAALRLATLTRPNGMATQFGYDANGRVINITEGKGATVYSSIALTRNAVGDIVSEDRTQTAAVAPAPGTQSFAFDEASQLASGASDDLGRLSRDGLRTYTWDGASRLSSYQGADGFASFTYDAFGMRITRAQGIVPESYVINYALGLPSVSVVKAANNNQRYYIYTPEGRLLYFIDAVGGARHYYHFDHAGNTLMLSDDTSAITDTYAITPYGESVVQAGTTNNPFTWQGAMGVMREPGTTLFYTRFRYYDSSSARFLSRDALLSLAPRAVNPYAYALGNPLTFMDPLGLAPSGMGASPVAAYHATFAAANQTLGALADRYVGPRSEFGAGGVSAWLSLERVLGLDKPDNINVSTAAPEPGLGEWRKIQESKQPGEIVDIPQVPDVVSNSLRRLGLK